MSQNFSQKLKPNDITQNIDIDHNNFNCNINNSMSKLVSENLFSENHISSINSEDVLKEKGLSLKQQKDSFESNVKKIHRKKTPETSSRLRRQKTIRSVLRDKSLFKKNYQVINELSAGNYFGEISVMTQLPATASIHAVSKSICCRISKKDFLAFIDNFSDCKSRLYSRIHEYTDSYFRFLHRIMSEVPYICRLDFGIIRSILLNMRRMIYHKDTTI